MNRNPTTLVSVLRGKVQVVSLLIQQKGSLWKSIAYIFSGNVTSAVINMVSSILVARWLLPDQMGVWNSANAVTIYFSLLHLGVFSGLNRELPFLIGKGSRDEAVAYAETSLAWALITTLVIGGCTVMLWVWLLASKQLEIAWTVLVLGLALGLQFIAHHYSATYKSHQEFSRLAQRSVMISSLGLLFLGFVWVFNYWGLLLKFYLTQICSLWILVMSPPFPVKPRLNIKRLWVLIKTGVPISIVGSIIAALKTLDILVLTRFGGKELVGQYTIALQVVSASVILSVSFTTVMFPTMARQYGSTNLSRHVFLLAVKAATGIMFAGLVFAIIGWSVIPLIVPIILPKYIPGIAVAQWSTLIFLLDAVIVVESVFDVLKKQHVFLLSALFNVVVFVVAWLWLSQGQTGSDLLVVAMQAKLLGLGARFLSSLMLTYWVCRRHDQVLARI